MFLKLFNSGAAAKLGAALAEDLIPPPEKSNAAARPRQAPRAAADNLQRLLHRIDLEGRPLKLGWYGRARLANAFKWRLLEADFAQDVADELTQVMLMHLITPASATPVSLPLTPNRAMRRRMAKKR